MRRISVWVLLGLALFTLTTAGLQVQAETPTEYECRPYIEKAIQDLKSESAEVADENGSIENTIDVTSQEEEDNTAAEEVSTEETDTATDDVTEEITPSEEVQEQLFADSAEDEPAESEPADDDEDAENVEETEETDQKDEDEQADAEQEQEEDATEENVQSEEAEQTVSEEAEQSDDVQTGSEELTSEESANQVLDDDDDLEEENAVKGSYDDREQEDDDEDVSAENVETVSEEASENDEVDDSSENTSQNDNEDLEGTNSEEQDTDTDNDDDEDDEEEALTEESVVSGEEAATEDEPTSEEVQDDDDDEENLSEEEAERDTVESSTPTSEEEEKDESEPEAVEQSEEQVVDSQEDESAAQDEASTEEPAEESSEDATTVEDVEATSQEQEEQSAEQEADVQEAAEESAEEAEADSAEQEAPEAAAVEGESEEEVAVKQDSEESLAQEEQESVEKASEETETASKEESFPEEDLLLEYQIPTNLRDTTHIYELLNINDDASAREKALQETADVILRDLKRIYDNSIKPLETLYKYRDLSNRHFGDPEIFSKPLVLFMGPWSGGKSTILNYLTHNEYTPNSVRTGMYERILRDHHNAGASEGLYDDNVFTLVVGAEPSPAYFNILMHGDEPEVLDGTQLAADWTFSGLQKFGQGLLDRLRGQKLPNQLLERVNIVEIPGILEVRKQVSKYFPFNDACQWFIDRADIIFLVYDPSKLDVGPETEAILDQLKGREYQTRILLNKADQVKPEELLRVQSALIWNISPLMSSAQPPVMYTVSLWSNPFEVGAPVRLLQAQERTLLLDLGQAIDRRIENKIASARRFAVRVRNHAKMVDCYLTTYYNHKTLFGNKKQISEKIIANPQDYHIYEGLSTLTNISRYDLPDPEVYRDFFHLNPLYEFKKLSETCTYFRGCPINKLDVAIAYELPELVGKYKKMSEAALAKLDVLTPTSDFGKGKSNS
uniref:EH domain-containing protein n=1 Tax=Anopheles culicifacies TaxID=139723 RepID=A0A182M2E6_9DIPT